MTSAILTQPASVPLLVSIATYITKNNGNCRPSAFILTLQGWQLCIPGRPGNPLLGRKMAGAAFAALEQHMDSTWAARVYPINAFVLSYFEPFSHVMYYYDLALKHSVASHQPLSVATSICLSLWAKLFSGSLISDLLTHMEEKGPVACNYPDHQQSEFHNTTTMPIIRSLHQFVYSLRAIGITERWELKGPFYNEDKQVQESQDESPLPPTTAAALSIYKLWLATIFHAPTPVRLKLAENCSATRDSLTGFTIYPYSCYLTALALID